MQMIKRGFGYKLLILIGILLVLPIALSAYMWHFINRTETAPIERDKAKLLQAMERLDAGFTESFEDILKKHDALKLSRREKVKILNRELEPIIAEVSANFPGVELGLYSRELDVLLDGNSENYGENFSQRRKIRRS